MDMKNLLIINCSIKGGTLAENPAEILKNFF